MTVLVSLEEKPEFDISIQPEEDGPEGWMDDELVPYVREQMAAGNEWAWCQVTVTASVGRDNQRFTGGDFLGGCSYRNEEDFIKPQFVVYPKGNTEKSEPTGYYEDMKDQAQADLVCVLQPVAEWLAEEVRTKWAQLDRYGIDVGHYDETEVVFTSDGAADVILRNTTNKAELLINQVSFVWNLIGEKTISQADLMTLGGHR
jgi:hypothetical protein